jgi:hypothetical protein
MISLIAGCSALLVSPHIATDSRCEAFLLPRCSLRVLNAKHIVATYCTVLLYILRVENAPRMIKQTATARSHHLSINLPPSLMIKNPAPASPRGTLFKPLQKCFLPDDSIEMPLNDSGSPNGTFNVNDKRFRHRRHL